MLAPERGDAGRRAVEHAAEREEIGPCVDRLAAARLLGREVARRAQELTRAGEAGRRLLHARVAGEHPRDAEVEDANVLDPSLDQEEVRRLQIAMDQVRRMRRLEPLTDADA